MIIRGKRERQRWNLLFRKSHFDVIAMTRVCLSILPLDLKSRPEPVQDELGARPIKRKFCTSLWFQTAEVCRPGLSQQIHIKVSSNTFSRVLHGLRFRFLVRPISKPKSPWTGHNRPFSILSCPISLRHGSFRNSKKRNDKIVVPKWFENGSRRHVPLSDRHKGRGKRRGAQGWCGRGIPPAGSVFKVGNRVGAEFRRLGGNFFRVRALLQYVPSFLFEYIAEG